MFNMFDSHTVQAVVLTGGRSSRMGGRHKPGIPVGGRTVIDRTLATLRSVAPHAKVVIAGSDEDRKSTRLNSSHVAISYAGFCVKKKNSSTSPSTRAAT